MIKAIFFDFDGVIYDSNEIKKNAFAELYKKYDKKIINDISIHHLHNGGMSRYEKIKFYHSKFLKIKITKNDLNILCNKFSRILKKKIYHAKFIKGFNKFINSNKLNFKCFVVSATPTNELIKICKKKGIEKIFEKILGSPTSKKDNILYLIKKYNYKKKEVVYIGDALNDYYAAIESKINFIGFGKIFNNSKYNKDHNVLDYSKLIGLINKL